jgi:hypothetical protein
MVKISRWEFVKIEHFLVILLNTSIIRWCHGLVSTRRKSQWPIRWCTYSLVGHEHWTGMFCFSHKKFLWTLYQSLVISLPVCIPYWSVSLHMLLDFAVNLNSRYCWVSFRALNFSISDNRKPWRMWKTDDLTMMFMILMLIVVQLVKKLCLSCDTRVHCHVHKN